MPGLSVNPPDPLHPGHARSGAHLQWTAHSDDIDDTKHEVFTLEISAPHA